MTGLHRISPHCWVSTSSFCSTNSVAVVGASEAVVIDPGVTGDELAGLVAGLAELGVGCAFGISTHPDWDHLLWHPDLGEVPRYASARAVAWLDADRLAAARDEAAPDAPGVQLTLLGLVQPLPREDVLEWDGPDLRLVLHDGHAPGHLAVVVDDDGVLVAGDMLSDIEPPLVDQRSDDPVGDYLRGLAAIEAAAGGCRILVPGHGSIARDAGISARITGDREWLQSHP